LTIDFETSSKKYGDQRLDELAGPLKISALALLYPRQKTCCTTKGHKFGRQFFSPSGTIYAGKKLRRKLLPNLSPCVFVYRRFLVCFL
jgi:hypothetical protein